MRKIIITDPDSDSGLMEVHKAASAGRREILTSDPSSVVESSSVPNKRTFLTENHGPQKPATPRPARQILP